MPQPQLAPPGAGLPPFELFCSRLGFALLRRVLSRRQVRAWLCAEMHRVDTIAGSFAPAQRQEAVLVPRLTGLEDSSRHWSAAMVLEHLVIVTGGIGAVIESLCADRDFGREVKIAEVKPGAAAGDEQFAALATTRDNFLARTDALDRLHTTRRHAHPWFGPLDAWGWYTLAALHTAIHRRQLAEIRKGLGG